jgi:hypothetical protein
MLINHYGSFALQDPFDLAEIDILPIAFSNVPPPQALPR